MVLVLNTALLGQGRNIREMGAYSSQHIDNLLLVSREKDEARMTGKYGLK